MPYKNEEDGVDISGKRIVGFVVAIALMIFSVVAIFAMWENLPADEIMVIQSPIAGDLTWHITPGVKWQGFGKITHYKRSSQYWFSAFDDQGERKDQSIQVRFNDGGHATISGSVRWDMPIDSEHLTDLHTRYGSHRAIEQALIRTVVEKAVYMTGPLMSSKESYAEKRNDLIYHIEDQIQNGVYKTTSREAKVKDAMTGSEKTAVVVEVVQEGGKKSRQEESPVQRFNIKTYNLSINKIPYDDVIEKQITKQQEAIMEVQTAIANAKKSEQAAITAEKNGQADAAKAKWDQEVIKAKMVTEAQQKLEVAKLERQAAEQTKLKEILLGEGEAQRKKLVMTADGALEKKLATYTEVNKLYAEAIGKYTGQWVPSIVMGGSSSGSIPVAQQLIELMTAKTARDLGLDMAISGKEKTSGK